MNATQQMAARRYRIERYLTEGGMGAIYIGKKLGPGGFEKEVVLKQLLPEYTARPEFRDLFFREAKISATLDHANIVHTFDLVESEESLFIVMEYVRGVDLRTIVRRARLRRRELATAAAIHITLDILAGLSYAHARRDASGASMGIIHRDVSPSNILCSAQGEVKLSDFGIAKASTHSSVFYRVRGKVGYMSPEQARNEPVDHRSDLYSLAVCLYEALTGERLFVGDLSTPPDVIYGQPILPPSRKRPGLNVAFDQVMAKALAPRPDDRYQDATAFTEALRQVAHRFGLMYSAPQLAEHLKGILGPDPTRWLQEDTSSHGSEGGTQKIPVKALEGKEAASIGVVEESDLDVVSPPRPNEPFPGRTTLPGQGDVPTRRVSLPTQDAPMAKAPTGARDPFIPIHEDDEDAPTVSRDRGFAPMPPPPVSLPRRPVTTAPYQPVAPGRRASLPPPPPASALASPLAPPPPPRLQPSRVFPDSPFDPDMPTPPPPVNIDEFAPPTPPSLFQPGAPRGAASLPPPAASWAPPPGPAHAPPADTFAPPPPSAFARSPSQPYVPPFNLQQPETIDFGATAQPLVVRRSGPPGLLVLIVVLGAMAGGAKLAHVVTRGDVAALDAPAPPAAAPGDQAR
jgi:eukaryotic-like serine/threonine-protein kinase